MNYRSWTSLFSSKAFFLWFFATLPEYVSRELSICRPPPPVQVMETDKYWIAVMSPGCQPALESSHRSLLLTFSAAI